MFVAFSLVVVVMMVVVVVVVGVNVVGVVIPVVVIVIVILCQKRSCGACLSDKQILFDELRENRASSHAGEADEFRQRIMPKNSVSSWDGDQTNSALRVCAPVVELSSLRRGEFHMGMSGNRQHRA